MCATLNFLEERRDINLYPLLPPKAAQGRKQQIVKHLKNMLKQFQYKCRLYRIGIWTTESNFSQCRIRSSWSKSLNGAQSIANHSYNWFSSLCKSGIYVSCGFAHTLNSFSYFGGLFNGARSFCRLCPLYAYNIFVFGVGKSGTLSIPVL